MELKSELGQVFTEEREVDEMISLIENSGKILEPSAGCGNFYRKLPKGRTVAIELDPDVTPEGAEVKDFFDETRKFSTIIGNPPYLAYNEIKEDTTKKLPKALGRKANLYMFFIWRCIDLLEKNGELIFIVPRDFIKLTSARPLNKRLDEEGGFTYWKEFGDEQVFKQASPNVVIFRWQKGIRHKILIYCNDGFFSFEKMSGTRLSDLFDIKVGGVTGANDIFYNKNGNISIACSETYDTGLPLRAYYGKLPELIPFKDRLISRGIRKFTENDWWEWGRKPAYVEGRKILVNCKTRKNRPFYISDLCYWDGSLLALIPKTELNLEEYLEKLNSYDWDKYGFKVGGRYIFAQKSLSSIMI